MAASQELPDLRQQQAPAPQQPRRPPGAVTAADARRTVNNARAKGAKATYENMGPSLLAAQPTRSAAPPALGNDWPDIQQHLESRLASLRNWRLTWWAYWAQLAEFILPKRYHWLIVPNRMARGAPINNSIIDSTATLAMQTCASGLWTGLTSPSRPWFKLGVGLPWVELDAEAKAWLEDAEKRVYTVLARSNFYTTMAQAFQDVATFGTAPVVIYEDLEDGIRCYLPCAGEYYLGAGARLSVDTIYREFNLTVLQIVEMFGLENCPSTVREMWAKGGGSIDTEFVVCHAIEPNFPVAKRGVANGEVAVVPEAFTYREVYWVKGLRAESELSRKGFYERPFMVARWSVTSNDPYGRSPGMDALGDVKQLQVETRRKAEFIEKLVRPPMGADPELKNEPSSILPGNITYVSAHGGKKGFYPLFEVNAQAMPPMVADIKEIQARIERCFFVDVFMAITRMAGVQPRNELELVKRDLERLQVLGPFIELFETEFASPAIQRIMAIMARRGLLQPPPPSLMQMPLKIEYVSIMKLAQRSTECVAVKDTLQTAGALSAAAKAAGVPDPLRVFDLDKALRIYAELANFPSEALFTEDEVQQHDQARQQANAQQMQQQQMMQATPAAVQAAGVLSKTQLGNGSNALSAMIGGG